ncbi:N-acyl homoserine lactonase family protein [Hoeflea sp. TYP-13]|uniref:N-acyl homoserine lactonase family protein n=1 Tax=Hoeflea sp. TYP-13 TaxID=3230023 RepID=UPI0034C6048E
MAAAAVFCKMAESQQNEISSVGVAIRSIRVLSSGWAEQHKEHRYGSWKPRLLWALTSRSWVKLPINYFLIDHRDGPILFDTGIDPAIVTNPGYISQWIGRFLLQRIFRWHITEEDRLDHCLKRLSIDPKNIKTAVISHLHFDHVGGISHIPQADILVSEQEWVQLSEPRPEREWILREHIKIPGAKWRPIRFQPSFDPLFADFEGTFDVAGDGSMLLLPTPGHTPGSLSMLIRQDGWKPILLVGDVTYEAQLLERNQFPGTGDVVALRKTYNKIRRLCKSLPGLVVVPSHDFGANDSIANAIRMTGRV